MNHKQLLREGELLLEIIPFIPPTKCMYTCFNTTLLLFSNLILGLLEPTNPSFFFKVFMSSSFYCQFSSLFSYKCLVRYNMILTTCCGYAISDHKLKYIKSSTFFFYSSSSHSTYLASCQKQNFDQIKVNSMNSDLSSFPSISSIQS